jgi:hypothetical protein
MGWAGNVARIGEIKNEYSVLVGKPEGKRPLGRSRRRWEDSIRMDIMKIWFEGVDWRHWLRMGPVADSCEHGNEISGSVKSGEFLS